MIGAPVAPGCQAIAPKRFSFRCLSRPEKRSETKLWLPSAESRYKEAVSSLNQYVAGLQTTPPTSKPLNRRNIDLPHRHHGFERAFAFVATDGQRFGQYARRDLPVDAPLVLAPAARALLAAVADDGVPIAVCLGLVLS